MAKWYTKHSWGNWLHEEDLLEENSWAFHAELKPSECWSSKLREKKFQNKKLGNDLVEPDVVYYHPMGFMTWRWYGMWIWGGFSLILITMYIYLVMWVNKNSS